MALPDEYNRFLILDGMRKRLFPKMNIAHAQVTSNKDVKYNCFAWAHGDTENKWQPPITGSPHNFVWFPSNRAFTLSTVMENFSYVGFELTDSRELEDGIEKIAIYTDPQSLEPTHAARQKENGKWTSKLGKLEDIEHETPECLESDDYGKVAVIMQRIKGDPAEWIRKALQRNRKSTKTLKN